MDRPQNTICDDILAASIDKANQTHATIWALSNMLKRISAESPVGRSTLFQLGQLAMSAEQMSNELIDSMSLER